ncbi:MAG: hypothetical protein IT555_06895 [Acetobacteraceae bacterium]|nr:hypothetical protein [Acetobacteraceae bacterium]
MPSIVALPGGQEAVMARVAARRGWGAGSWPDSHRAIICSRQPKMRRRQATIRACRESGSQNGARSDWTAARSVAADWARADCEVT